MPTRPSVHMCIPASGDELQHGRVVPQHAFGHADDSVHPRHAPIGKHVLQHLHAWPGGRWMCREPFLGVGIKDNQKETSMFEGPKCVWCLVMPGLLAGPNRPVSILQIAFSIPTGQNHFEPS